MKLREALETSYGDDSNNLPETTKENRFERLVSSIKSNDSLKMTQIIHDVPRTAISSTISKLKRYKYKKYQATEVAISKLKWRRGH